ncbi:MAG: hypothetical protein KIT11_05295 [Fimbriimonadaceae bacterium]|nr:hypothetical protein [Fimbriimonadaceae bacterium]QYK56693.1 MAG: hypothetical protein KF733_04225 [Fimbriimonadaceae bacterium]
MRAKEKPLWTVGRQILGNVLPLLVGLPFLVVGVLEFARGGTWALAWLAGFPVATWLATNFLSPLASAGLKEEVARRLQRERPFEKVERHFVGFARPGYRGMLDPHEDVGFLLLHADRLEFYGAERHLELWRSEVKAVRFRPNPHTWVGLGRWVSVEGVSAGKPVRLLVEPREKATLIGNLVESGSVRRKLAAWLGTVPEPNAKGPKKN